MEFIYLRKQYNIVLCNSNLRLPCTFSRSFFKLMVVAVNEYQLPSEWLISLLGCLNTLNASSRTPKNSRKEQVAGCISLKIGRREKQHLQAKCLVDPLQ